MSEVRIYSCHHNRHVKSKRYNCGWDCEFVDKGFWEHIPPESDYVLWEDYNRLKEENKKFRVVLSMLNPPQESEETEAPKQDPQSQ